MKTQIMLAVMAMMVLDLSGQCKYVELTNDPFTGTKTVITEVKIQANATFKPTLRANKTTLEVFIPDLVGEKVQYGDVTLLDSAMFKTDAGTVLVFHPLAESKASVKVNNLQTQNGYNVSYSLSKEQVEILSREKIIMYRLMVGGNNIDVLQLAPVWGDKFLAAFSCLLKEL